MTGPDDQADHPRYPGPDDPQFPPYSGPGSYSYGSRPQPASGGSYRPPFDGRLAIRPAPRAGVSLAGVGAAVFMLGAFIWALAYVTDGLREAVLGGGSSSRHYVAAVGFLALVVIAYAIAIVRRRGPIVTAAVTASVIGVPVMMVLFTMDLQAGSTANGDAVFWVSLAAYLASYLFVRGARGHTIYLGFAAVQLWSYVVAKAEPHLGEALAARIIGGIRSIPGLVAPPSRVSFTTVGAISLVFGIGYLLLAWWCDCTGRHGPATPLALVGLLVILAGIAAFAPDAKQIGSGLLLIVIGLAMLVYGGKSERRFTTWTAALAAGFGAVLVVTKLLQHSNATAGGFWLLVAGVVLVALGALLRNALDEPDDMARARGTQQSASQGTQPGRPIG
jgi:hypothetical protein